MQGISQPTLGFQEVNLRSFFILKMPLQSTVREKEIIVVISEAIK